MKNIAQFQGVASSGKRRNVTLSCAECRRLKLKCSREFPCTNCVKKGGVKPSGPEGSLTTGKGNRFVLANTEFLHDKINALSNRVRQLEDALEHSHSRYSSQPHPLLSADLRALKKPIEKGNESDLLSPLISGSSSTGVDLNDGDVRETNEIIDAIGSLTMAQPDRINYHGPSANAFDLLKNEGDSEEDEGDEDDLDYSLPETIPWLSYSFPFSPDVGRTADYIREQLLSCLPEPSEARQLSSFYFLHAAWMYVPITETEYMQEVFPLFYDHSMSATRDPLESHKLAILFLVFAMGKLLDLRGNTILTQDAMKYLQFAKAALSLNQFLDARSVSAVQALVLMCHFMFLANIENSRWVVMGLVVKLAQSLGLHRDGAKFGLDPEETHKRRCLMYEIYTYDSWQSLTFGRPPSFPMSSIDCEMPFDTIRNDQGELEMSFDAWKHRFSTQCLSIVHDQAYGARTPNYKIIQELDKKVRGFYIPPSLEVPGFSGKMAMSPMAESSTGEREQSSLQLALQRYITRAIKEISIFYMHRGYFARSVEDNKDDPLGGRYGSSVIAAHASACTFVNLIKSLHSQHAELAERMWFLFTHVFSCSIVLGSIASQCPGVPLSGSAFINLDSACKLFENVSHNSRATKVIPVLRRLRERAMNSMNDYRSKRSLLPKLTMEDSHMRQEEDELATLGGKTRLVVARKSPSVPSSRAGSDSLSNSSPRENPSTIRAHSDSPPYPESSNVMSINAVMDSPITPMTQWQQTWGPISQNTAYRYTAFPASNNQYDNTGFPAWYNNAALLPSPQNQYPQNQSNFQQQFAHFNDPQMMNLDLPPLDENIYNSPPSSSSLGGAMMSFDYTQQNRAPQQSTPPSNDAHADWQRLFAQTLQEY